MCTPVEQKAVNNSGLLGPLCVTLFILSALIFVALVSKTALLRRHRLERANSATRRLLPRIPLALVHWEAPVVPAGDSMHASQSAAAGKPGRTGRTQEEERSSRNSAESRWVGEGRGAGERGFLQSDHRGDDITACL